MCGPACASCAQSPAPTPLKAPLTQAPARPFHDSKNECDNDESQGAGAPPPKLPAPSHLNSDDWKSSHPHTRHCAISGQPERPWPPHRPDDPPLSAPNPSPNSADALCHHLHPFVFHNNPTTTATRRFLSPSNDRAFYPYRQQSTFSPAQGSPHSPSPAPTTPSCNQHQAATPAETSAPPPKTKTRGAAPLPDQKTAALRASTSSPENDKCRPPRQSRPPPDADLHQRLHPPPNAQPSPPPADGPPAQP